jgi:DNA-binding HxlR family transcriptional regulator
MQIEDSKKKNLLIRITKVDQFLRFFSFLKDFSVNKFKNLYKKGKDLVNFFSDTKNILILSRFTVADTLAFTEIQKDLQLSSSLLAYNLNRMTELGFVKKTYQRSKNKYSFYKLTDLGAKVVSQIFIPVS